MLYEAVFIRRLFGNQLHPGLATMCHPPWLCFPISLQACLCFQNLLGLLSLPSLHLGHVDSICDLVNIICSKGTDGKKNPQKNCLDIQNIWLEQAIYFSISMRQFGEDKGQLTSFHNFQKVQVKDSECISSQPAMNFVLLPEAIGKLFFLVHLLLFSFYTLKIGFFL